MERRLNESPIWATLPATPADNMMSTKTYDDIIKEGWEMYVVDVYLNDIHVFRCGSWVFPGQDDGPEELVQRLFPSARYDISAEEVGPSNSDYLWYWAKHSVGLDLSRVPKRSRCTSCVDGQNGTETPCRWCHGSGDAYHIKHCPHGPEDCPFYDEAVIANAIMHGRSDV